MSNQNEVQTLQISETKVITKKPFKMPGDSCIHQLILITHEVHIFFDASNICVIRG